MLPQVGHWEKVVWRNVFLHVPPDFGIPSCVDCKRPDLSDKLGEELARLQKARGVKPLQDRRLQHMKYASRGYSARGCPCRLCVQDGWARNRARRDGRGTEQWRHAVQSSLFTPKEKRC